MARLRIEVPGSPSSEIELGDETVTIGRDPGNTLALHVPWLSRFHAQILWDGTRHRLEDLGSRNGTYLNGGKLRHPLPLAHRDWITIGDLHLYYSEGEEEGEDLEDLPAQSTVLLRSQDLTMESYREATRERSVLSEASLLPSLHAVASALIQNYPLDELSGVVLKMAQEAVSAERGALLLRPRGQQTSSRRRPRIPRRRDGGDSSGSADVDTGSLATEELVRRALPGRETGTVELPFIARQEVESRRVLAGMRLAAAVGYDEGEEIQISRTILRQVQEGQRAVLTLDAQTDERFGHAVSIQLEGIRSIICVPLWNNRDVIGVLYLDHLMAGRVFSEVDLRLVGLIANMAAVKIENVYLLEEQIEKQRLEEQLSVGAKIQRRLLPSKSPDIEGYDLHGHNRSCYEIGGDYFDFIPKPDGKWALVIADVAGKGVGAALLMAVLQASLRALAGTAEEPAALVARLNQVLVENSPANKFATLFYGELDPQRHELEFVNCGHVPPGFLKADGRIELLNPGGPSVGLFPEIEFESRRIHLAAGATLLLCTDGVTELENVDGEEFGRERLMSFLEREDVATAASLAERLESRLATFCDQCQFADDSTVLVLRRKN